MACPFLKEGRARYCHAAPVRKLILDGPGVADGGRCATADYRKCDFVAKDAVQDTATHCPHLEEIRVQYCGAAPVTKLVPFSESQLSSCADDSYRYCDSYLSVARPRATTPPARILYAPNHFWLDAEDSGFCHLGLDAFLMELAGAVDAITFVTVNGTHCPTLALTVHGVEWPMSFPNPLIIHRVNSRAGRDPARLASDPYGAGWLFEGWEVPGRTRIGLIAGPQANAWQEQERERLAREIHSTHALNCDGGVPVRGVAQLLPRQHVVRLFQHFFAKRDWAVEE